MLVLTNRWVWYTGEQILHTLHYSLWYWISPVDTKLSCEKFYCFLDF